MAVGRFVITARLKGVDAAVRRIDKIEGGRARITDILFGGVKTIRSEQERLAPVKTRALRRSLVAEKGRVAAWTKVDFSKITGRENAKGGNRYPYVVEYGAPRHRIAAKPGKRLRYVNSGGVVRFAKSVNHPGAKPDPFFSDGIRNKKRQVTQEIKRGIFAIAA